MKVLAVIFLHIIGCSCLSFGQADVEQYKQNGERLARVAIANFREFSGGRIMTGEAGLIVAEGDSWFDYPFFDVIKRLESNYNYDIKSVARKGDTLESIAYDASQLEGLVRAFEKLKVKGKRPKVVLLSAGGNDVAGDELAIMINHKKSGLPPINYNVADGVIEGRLKPAMVGLISSVSALCAEYFEDPKIPVIIHGYDYPYPDGRGYLGGHWKLPGPWLEPALSQKGYPTNAENLNKNREIIGELLGMYNQMLSTIPEIAGFDHVIYLKLVGSLKSPDYKRDWNDEMHPTRRGFDEVAKRFHNAIQRPPLR